MSVLFSLLSFFVTPSANAVVVDFNENDYLVGIGMNIDDALVIK